MRTASEDLRSDPTFARYRHEIWSLLRDEVVKAQAQERDPDRATRMEARASARSERSEPRSRGRKVAP